MKIQPKYIFKDQAPNSIYMNQIQWSFTHSKNVFKYEEGKGYLQT